jgi:hypothetical protein
MQVFYLKNIGEKVSMMIDSLDKGTRSLTPQMIIDKFDKKGIKLSEKDAEKYLDLLYFLAKLVVKHHLL